MAWRIVKQPDGLYARFSDIVDAFTHLNLTAQDAVDLCRTQGMSDTEAEAKVERGHNAPERWEESLNIIRNMNGEEAVTKVLQSVRRS